MGPIEATPQTKRIVSRICPKVEPLTVAQEKYLADTLEACMDGKRGPFEAKACSAYIFALSHWKLARDRSRACQRQ